MEVKVEPSMAESAGRKGEISEVPPPRGSSILAGEAGKNLERGDDEPARQSQDIVEVEAESSMAEFAGRKGKIGEKARLPPLVRLVGKSIDFLKEGTDKLVRRFQRELKRGKGGPASLYLHTVKLEAESSMDEQARLSEEIRQLLELEDENAAITGRRVEDEPARLNQDMIQLEADVILSYSGSGNVFGFVESLYHSLVAEGIHVLRYDENLSILPEELRLSVPSSKIYIPIFSRTYFYSPRCLETLALMVEHTSRSGGKKAILPVFYDVERSAVQLEKNKSLYTDALDAHRRRWGAKKVEWWKKALVEAGKLKGREGSSYKSEGKLVRSIVEEILRRLKIKHYYGPEDLSTGDNPMVSTRTWVYISLLLFSSLLEYSLLKIVTVDEVSFSFSVFYIT